MPRCRTQMLAFLSSGALLSGCNPSSAATVRVILRAERATYNQCYFNAEISNQTKYHLNSATILIGDREITLKELPAGGTDSRTVDSEMVQPGVKDYGSCLEDTRRIYEAHPISPRIVHCDMPNVAEGDCQKMIQVVPAFRDEDIRASDAAVMRNAR